MKVQVFTFHSDTDHGQDTDVFTSAAALCQAIYSAIEKSDPDFVCVLSDSAFESDDWLRSWGCWKERQAERQNYYHYTTQEIDVPEVLPGGLFVMQVPTINLSHITAQDWDMLSLNLKDHCLAVVEDGHGHIITFAASDIDADFSDAKGFSQTFRNMLQHFANKGFQYLRLDPDFDACAALPTFAW
ncbi:MAG TPA: hypothetical protein VGE39_06775 [Prosthecobacter sp.]